jgi:DNA-binding LacI/PurR family transcriptional regulator
MPKRTESPTMRDVAQLVGVSVQTVSAVVNDKPGISNETRERVAIAIDQLGYSPYSVARSLRTRRTNTIALIVSDIDNPSFSAIASAAEDYVHGFGYSLVVYNTRDSVERESSYIRTAIERWVDGVLFVATQDQLTSLDRLREMGIPSVAIDRMPEGYEWPAVTLDNVKAGQLATEHLIELGHRTIAHIGGPQRLRLARERLHGYQVALDRWGLASGPVAFSESWACEEGYQIMRRLLEKPAQASQTGTPTAVVCSNDRMAIGAMLAISEAGLRVPEDISVTGLDDIEVAAFYTPPLTTVRQSFSELATQGVKLLLALINGEPPERLQIVLQPELVVRESTAKAKVEDAPQYWGPTDDRRPTTDDSSLRSSTDDRRPTTDP